MSEPSQIPPVSLAVTACNEESRLGKCLVSVRGLVREIVVVDSGSNDGTVAIAKAAEARVIYQEWLGHSAQKQVALDACTQPWVLILDADEEISEALRQSIIAFFSSGDVDWFHGCRFNRKGSFSVVGLRMETGIPTQSFVWCAVTRPAWEEMPPTTPCWSRGL